MDIDQNPIPHKPVAEQRGPETNTKLRTCEASKRDIFT